MISFPNFCPKFLFPILSTFPQCSHWGQNWGQNGDKNCHDSDESSLEKLPYMQQFFMQSKYFQHDDVHKKLTAFLSMPSHSIFKNIV